MFFKKTELIKKKGVNMGKCFSSQELYKLRNSIPIDVLIEKRIGSSIQNQ